MALPTTGGVLRMGKDGGVSNLEAKPVETDCRTAAADGARTVWLPSRDVPLGGIRGVTVARYLPHRDLPTVGAWCFLDRFGPEQVDMRVLPHPHTGLQTVTWPLRGEIRHRDSLGSDVLIRPGQLNLMTAGRGVAHSEISLGSQPMLHGLQLWVALPSDVAGMDPGFERHTDLPVYEGKSVTGTVFMGALGAVESPATAFSPLIGAMLDVSGNARLPLRADFEYGLLVVEGSLSFYGTEVQPGGLLYLGSRRTSLELSTSRDARVVLLGGEPFPDDLVMWWNFVGRSHEEIVEARADWANSYGRSGTRFGVVPGHPSEEFIPAPELPPVRMRPRRRR